jgi:hypothetical protein
MSMRQIVIVFVLRHRPIHRDCRSPRQARSHHQSDSLVSKRFIRHICIQLVYPHAEQALLIQLLTTKTHNADITHFASRRVVLVFSLAMNLVLVLGGLV